MSLDQIIHDMEESDVSNKESDFFKIPVGQTKMRILTDFYQTYSLYEGEYPNSKYVGMLSHFKRPNPGYSIKTSAWAWALIKGKESQLKVIQFPYSLIKALGALRADPDWEFKSFPMEYDITVTNTGEGGSRYSLIGSPKKTAIADSVYEDLKGRKSCEEIAKKIMEKQGDKTEKAFASTFEKGPKVVLEASDDDIDPESIPF